MQKIFTTTLTFLLFSLACLTNNIAAAQETGTVTGQVKDKATNETIPGAVILIKDTHKGKTTDLEGKFEMKLEPGVYTFICNYIGYKKTAARNIKVVAGKISKVNFDLEVSDTLSKEVQVVHAKLTNTENAVLNEIKKTDNVASGVSAVQISKSLDRDAAEVVRRVPGVTIIENRFILVRGLSDRYNSVWLNDAQAPSAESDKRAFSFDVIPSALIDRIMIYKAASAELPGDFAGGMVKIYTSEFPSKKTFSIGLSTSYRAGTTLQPFSYNQSSPTDIFGFDNGMRSIPSIAPDRIQRNADNNAQIANAFKDNWAVKSGTAMPDMRFNLNYMNTYDIKKVKLGVVSSVNYTNTNLYYSAHRTDYDSADIANDYTDKVYNNTVRIGLLQNFSMLVGNSKFFFKNLYNQTGSSQTTLRTSNLANENLKAYEFAYGSRGTLSSQLGGVHMFKDEKFTYNWTLGYSHTRRNDPDLRRIAYSKQPGEPDSMYKAEIPSGGVDPNFGGGRLYRTLTEAIYSFSHNLNYKFKVHNLSPELNAGNYVEYRDRSFNARVIGPVIFPGAQAQQLERLPIDQIFQPQNFGNGGFRLDEITNPSDAYSGQNKLLATYASLNLPVNKFKITGGLRGEYNIQSLQSYVNTNPVSPSVTTFFLLPSTNISYHFTDKSLLRVAYGKTLNRPEFREWSPFKFYDFNLNALTNGSLFSSVLYPNGTTLKVAEIQNVDLRYEFYPSMGETFQIGGFYKNFRNPIEQAILVSSGDSRSFSFTNANSAYLYGVEMDVRKKVYKNFSVLANASLIKSQVTVLQSVNQQKTRPLQGQSPYVINVGLYYQDTTKGLQVTLLYNVFGPRIYVVGSKDYPSIGELPVNSLDLTISKSVTRRITLTLGAQNIINQQVRLVQDTNKDNIFSGTGTDKNFRSYRPGSYFTLGARLNL